MISIKNIENAKVKTDTKSYQKKTHKWEGGAHLRISFWHLLMNFEKLEKSEFWKIEKEIANDIIILHICTKNQDHMWYSYWEHLEVSLFHTCTRKTWSYDVCLLRYGVQQTWFFVILGHFCSFTPISKPKI